jgi:hypothetical protein
MPMPIILDVKTKKWEGRKSCQLKSGRKYRVVIKHDSTEEIESITLDPDHVFG